MAGQPVVHPLDELARDVAFVDEWRDLLAAVDGSSFFQTPQWILSWWEDVGCPPSRVAIWRDANGRLAAVVPLTEVRERLHRRLPESTAVPILTNAGSGPPHSADHGGWIALDHFRADVQRWLFDEAQRHPILLRHLDPACIPAGDVSAQLVLVTRCPRLGTAARLEDLQVSAQMRQQIRRRQRRARDAGVTFRWIPPGESSAELLDVLFTLHESRRTLKPEPSSFSRERSYGFHRRLLTHTRRDSGVAFLLAERDGNPVGVLYGFVWRDTFSYYQGGWDASLASQGVGMALHAEAILAAHARGITTYDLLRGAEAYKYRLGAVDRLDETWLLGRGARRSLIGAKYRAVRRQQVSVGRNRPAATSARLTLARKRADAGGCRD